MVAAYQNPQRDLADRVDDLVERMTRLEKIAQLGAVDVGRLDVQPSQVPEVLMDLSPGGVGYVVGLQALVGEDPEGFAEAVNALQERLRQGTRLGIPAMVGVEPRGGAYAPGGCRYPEPLALAATFNTTLLRDLGWAVRTELRALGVDLLIGPCLNLAGLDGWEDCSQSFGSDPYLVGRMGVALLRGLQGDRLDEAVLAAARAFPGCHVSAASRVAAVGERELRERFVEPFAAAIREAGLDALVCADGAVDGVPVTASRHLLNALLREELGFRGVVLASAGDGGAMGALATRFGIAADAEAAVRQAMLAGVDVALADGDRSAQLEAANADRSLDDAIDVSVRRVLKHKFSLGLFDERRAEPQRARQVCDAEAHRALAARVAEQSVVLLKNSGVLPLASQRRVALFGSRAGVADLLPHLAARTQVVWAATGDAFATAADLEDVEIAVWCVLGRQGASVADPEYADTEVVRRLADSGLPVVLVASGSPNAAVSRLGETAAAVLVSYSGSIAQRAVADVLSGAVNPSGRLPVSIGTVPGGGDKDADHGQAYPFGHGLSYSRFSYGELDCPDAVDVHSAVDVALSVRNESSVAGEEVVQLYVADKLADVVRPARQLVGVQRVWLGPGEERRVSFRFDVTQLAYFDQELEYVVDAGEVDVIVGASSTEVLRRRRLMVRGERRVLRQQQRLATQSQVAGGPG